MTSKPNTDPNKTAETLHPPLSVCLGTLEDRPVKPAASVRIAKTVKTTKDHKSAPAKP